MTTKLMPESQAPALAVNTLQGDRFELAAEAPRNFTMVVFYRGYHCPVCKAYLQKLDGLADQYQQAGFSVIAISMDGAERAGKAASEWELANIRIGYGLGEDTARQWGLYISKAIKEAEAEIFAEPGLFWVRPDGRLYLIDIANMPWARPDPAFLLSKVPFAVDNNYPARGGHRG
ncbi:MAG: redoxin domain-containing protein [Geminicoccaceae bacterium]